MIGGTEKSEKRVLPGIQEDIQRSTDSLSTLGGETLTIQSSEADLFKDIRASIQKSSQVSNVANSNNEKRLGVTESQTMQCKYLLSCCLFFFFNLRKLLSLLGLHGGTPFDSSFEMLILV